MRAEAGLAAVAVGGAILTLGLVQRWGEVFPRWMTFLSGRRVPITLAVVPEIGLALDENWAALAPELLWPVWGSTLAAATLAHYYRRRGVCRLCRCRAS